MGWELAAIWAIIVTAAAGFIWEELQRRREAQSPGPRVKIVAIEAERRALGESARLARVARPQATRPDERRRAHLRAIGF